jgi:hypothetical protein
MFPEPFPVWTSSQWLHVNPQTPQAQADTLVVPELASVLISFDNWGWYTVIQRNSHMEKVEDVWQMGGKAIQC